VSWPISHSHDEQQAVNQPRPDAAPSQADGGCRADLAQHEDLSSPRFIDHERGDSVTPRRRAQIEYVPVELDRPVRLLTFTNAA
jgi:hypothetical protein